MYTCTHCKREYENRPESCRGCGACQFEDDWPARMSSAWRAYHSDFQDKMTEQAQRVAAVCYSGDEVI